MMNDTLMEMARKARTNTELLLIIDTQKENVRRCFKRRKWHFDNYRDVIRMCADEDIIRKYREEYLEASRRTVETYRTLIKMMELI